MTKRFSFITLLIVGLTSCAANIPPSITLPVISAPTNLSDTGKGAMVFLEEVRDERGVTNIGQTSEGLIAATGSVPSTVRDGLEDMFRKSGFMVTDSAPVVLQTSLQKWDVDVSGRLSSNVSSNAKVTIQVYDPANRLAYTGKYQGSAQIQQSAVDEVVVKEALSTSMGQVLQQIASDKGLIKLLSAY